MMYAGGGISGECLDTPNKNKQTYPTSHETQFRVHVLQRILPQPEHLGFLDPDCTVATTNPPVTFPTICLDFLFIFIPVTGGNYSSNELHHSLATHQDKFLHHFSLSITTPVYSYHEGSAWLVVL